MKEGDWMAINSSSLLRIGGLASGIDTDSVISGLMKAERIPLDRIKQKNQINVWKTEQYREVTNLLRGLKDEYLNILKQSNNMMSQTSYKQFTTTSTDSSIVTVSG